MATSKQLRHNTKQHAPKNKKSKKDDKAIYQAMSMCIQYLEKRFKKDLKNYNLAHAKVIRFSDIIKLVKDKNVRSEFDTTFINREIKPDGGVIWLTKQNNNDYKKLVLVSEVKKQGTNDERVKEGKKKQAQGNAIERLGKNLIGVD